MKKALFISLILFLVSVAPVEANVFDFVYGLVNDRPACNRIEEYLPGVYAQAPMNQDCSIIGFRFFVQEMLDKTTVTPNPNIQHALRKVGARLFEVDQIRLDDPTSQQLIGMGGASLDRDIRPEHTITTTNLHEIAGPWTNNQSTPTTTNFRMENIGFTHKTLSIEEQLRERVDYCYWLHECMNDSHADEPYLSQGRFDIRCHNPQGYDIYPEDPSREEIVYEDQICDEALAVIKKYEPNYSEALGDPDFKTPTSAPIQLQQEKDLAEKFLLLNPTSRAKSVVVACSDPDNDAQEHQTASSHVNFLQRNTFDCFEAILPSGFAAACQAMLQQAQNTMSYAEYQQLTQGIKVKPVDLTSASNQGPLVQYSSAITDPAFPFGRKYWYAKRINAAADELEMIPASEQGGETNTNPEDFLSSGIIQQLSDITVNLPNESGETHTAITWWTIAPPGFDYCLNQLAFEDDHSFVKSRTSYLAYQDNQDDYDSNIALEGTSNIQGEFQSEEDCLPLRDETGAIVVDPDTGQPVIDESTCIYWEGEFNPEEDGFYMPGGNEPKFAFLHYFFQWVKSYFADDSAAGLECDKYGFITGNPDPDCQSEFYNQRPVRPIDQIATINCDQTITDDQIPGYAGAIKDRVIDLADRWYGGEFETTHYARECYNDVVYSALNYNPPINPLFALTIWLNESGASNYAGAAARGLRVQDFGINVLSQAQPEDFEAQLGAFLKTASPKSYFQTDDYNGEPREKYAHCFENATPMQGFMSIYHLGGGGCLNSDYFQSIFGTTNPNTAASDSKWGWVNQTTGCLEIPEYPTDFVCTP